MTCRFCFRSPPPRPFVDSNTDGCDFISDKGTISLLMQKEVWDLSVIRDGELKTKFACVGEKKEKIMEKSECKGQELRRLIPPPRRGLRRAPPPGTGHQYSIKGKE